MGPKIGHDWNANSACKRASRAFSVVEIMLAVSLLSIIIVGLLAMFYQVQRAFRAGTSQVDVMESGRALMGIFSRDLQEMASTRVSPDQFEVVTNCVITPSESPSGPDSLTTEALASGAARENYLRDICFISRVGDDWIATAYRIGGASNGVGTLYRMVEHRTNDSNPEINIAKVIVPLSQIMLTSRVDNPNFHQVVDGVVHFLPLPCGRNGQICTNTFQVPGQSGSFSYAFTNSFLPAYIDLELGVLEPGAVEKVRVRGEIDPTQVRATNYLAQQIGRTHLFRQRIPVKAGASAD